MREFFSTADGTSTLGDAVIHWEATRKSRVSEIGKQFQRNQFTRTWFAEHPDGTRNELHKAWQLHRSLPVDQRP